VAKKASGGPTTDELIEELEEKGARGELERRLRKPIPDDVWRAIVAAEPPRYPIDDPELWLEDVVSPAQRLVEAFSEGAGISASRERLTTSRRGSDVPKGEDPRWQALSEILALRAAWHPDVITWRNVHLPGGPIAPDEVEGFIERLYEDDRRELRAGKVAFTFEVFAYTTPAGEQHKLGIAERGPLRELLGIGERLRRHFHWFPPDAVSFVLTDVPPTFFPITCQIDVDRWAGTSRIVIDADPRVPPTAIAETFAAARKDEALSETEIGERFRPVHEKLARLAVFVARHRKGSWREQREQWNAECRREWTYGTEREFARDAKRAWIAVVGERLSPTNRKGDSNG
jgi:hypothetical protein